MPRRNQTSTQKLAIGTSTTDHSRIDNSYLDHHRQQLQQLEQQLQQHQQQQQQQLQQQQQQQQQQEQFQRQQHLQQLQHEKEDKEDDEDDEDDDRDDDEDEINRENEQLNEADGSTTASTRGPPIRGKGVVGRNVNLTNSQRKAICQMRIDNPDMTLSALGVWAQKEFNLFREPAMGTLSRIVHKEDVYNNMNDLELQVQRKRTVLCPELEEALLEWIRECQEREIHVTYRMITKKGLELGTYIKSLPGRGSFTLPSFSNGWVSGFTKRNALYGAKLNPAASIQAMPDDEFTASESFRPFSTNQQLVDRVMQPRYRPRVLANPPQNNRHLINTDQEQESHGDDIDMTPSLSDMHMDIHHQVLHAVAGTGSYSTTQSAVPEMPTAPQTPSIPDTPIKKVKARKPRGTGTPRRSKAAKLSETMDATETSHMEDVVDTQEHFSQLNLQQQQQAQHQIHPATPGLNGFRAHQGDRISPTDSTALLNHPLTHPQAHPAQALHQLQQQQQRQQQQLQTMLPSVSIAGGNAANDLVASVPVSVPTVDPISTTTTSATRTTEDIIAAVQIVIDSLNSSIPGEAALLKPLFEMERRLQNQVHANDRQASMMSWNK